MKPSYSFSFYVIVGLMMLALVMLFGAFAYLFQLMGY